MIDQSVTAEEITRHFGPAPFDVVTPAPPVGTIVHYHQAVRAGFGLLEIRPLAAIVVGNTDETPNQPGRPLTLLIIPPDGSTRIEADVEAGGETPYPGFWSPIEADPHAVLWSSWRARR